MDGCEEMDGRMNGWMDELVRGTPQRFCMFDFVIITEEVGQPKRLLHIIFEETRHND